MSNPVTTKVNSVPKSKSDIEILNQEIDEDEGQYRIRAGNRVHYVTIPGYASPNRIFDQDTLCRPYLLVPKLPQFPDGDWTKMRLSLGPDGSVQPDISFEPLDQVEFTWHPQHIDVLSLKRTKYHKQRVREVEYQGKPAISKIAVLQWLVPQVEHEARMYEALTRLQCPGEVRITPEALGHLLEGGEKYWAAFGKDRGSSCDTGGSAKMRGGFAQIAQARVCPWRRQSLQLHYREIHWERQDD